MGLKRVTERAVAQTTEFHKNTITTKNPPGPSACPLCQRGPLGIFGIAPDKQTNMHDFAKFRVLRQSLSLKMPDRVVASQAGELPRA
jgi:hypothetical protein